MKRNRTGVLLIVFATCGLRAEPAIDVSGTWTGDIRGQDGGTGRVCFVLHQAGAHISGTAGPADKPNPPRIYDVKLEGSHLTFAADDADDTGLTLTYHFDLTVANDRMQGKAQGRSGDRSWTLDISMTREK
jgi:hypothetical protein